MRRAFQKAGAFLRPFKMGIIFALMGLAVYQTGRLWFVGINNRSFYSLFTGATVGDAEVYRRLTRPYRIAAGAGDGRFRVLYNSLAETEALAYGEAALETVLRSGAFAGAQAADYAQLYSRPCYVFEYAYPADAAYFTQRYGRRPGLLTARGLTSVDAAVIQPPTGAEPMGAVFLSGGTAYTFRIDRDSELSERFAHTVAPAEGPGPVYGFTDGRFRPLTGEAFSCAGLTVTNPYANDFGEKLINDIQRRVEPLFANPAAIKADVGADGIYTFQTPGTVVRYTDRDILEYVSYRAVDRSTAVSFVTDYLAAHAFLSADAYVANEFYLTSFERTEDRHIFRFDFAVNDLPLFLSEGHPIEITVDHGSVTRYQKLTYRFTADETAARFPAPDPPKEPAMLGYWIEPSAPVTLAWRTDAGGFHTAVSP